MDKDQEIERLRQENHQKDELIAALQAQLAGVLQRLNTLEKTQGKDSHNSHLPPSSDRFAHQSRRLRKKSDKPSGGQKDHPGKHLTPEICSCCHHDLG